jgi:hypothetical protein
MNSNKKQKNKTDSRERESKWHLKKEKNAHAGLLFDVVSPSLSPERTNCSVPGGRRWRALPLPEREDVDKCLDTGKRGSLDEGKPATRRRLCSPFSWEGVSCSRAASAQQKKSERVRTRLNSTKEKKVTFFPPLRLAAAWLRTWQRFASSLSSTSCWQRALAAQAKKKRARARE